MCFHLRNYRICAGGCRWGGGLPSPADAWCNDNPEDDIMEDKYTECPTCGTHVKIENNYYPSGRNADGLKPPCGSCHYVTHNATTAPCFFCAVSEK